MQTAPDPEAAGAASPARSAIGLGSGARACVVALSGTPDRGERLSAMGLGVGATFQVLRGGRSMTVRVGETTLALGPDWAAALTVVEW